MNWIPGRNKYYFKKRNETNIDHNLINLWSNELDAGVIVWVSPTQNLNFGIEIRYEMI
jgi:hypothetical protein